MTCSEADAALASPRDADVVSESDVPGRHVFQPSGLMICIHCMADRLIAVEFGRPNSDVDVVRF